MFEILSCGGDVAVWAAGANAAELLRCLLRGMFAAARPRWTDAETVERRFFVTARDPVAVVVAFLDEALALSDLNGEAYADVRFSSVTDTSAEGILFGKPVTGFGVKIRKAFDRGIEIRHRSEENMVETIVTFAT